jgi:hypothetical protein
LKKHKYSSVNAHKNIKRFYFYFIYLFIFYERQAWCNGESCRGFEATSLQILRGKCLLRFIPSPDSTHVGASGTGSALIYLFFAKDSMYSFLLGIVKHSSFFPHITEQRFFMQTDQRKCLFYCLSQIRATLWKISQDNKCSQVSTFLFEQSFFFNRRPSYSFACFQSLSYAIHYLIERICAYLTFNFLFYKMSTYSAAFTNGRLPNFPKRTKSTPDRRPVKPIACRPSVYTKAVVVLQLPEPKPQPTHTLLQLQQF